MSRILDASGKPFVAFDESRELSEATWRHLANWTADLINRPSMLVKRIELPAGVQDPRPRQTITIRKPPLHWRCDVSEGLGQP